jgi:hypothetical protein
MGEMRNAYNILVGNSKDIVHQEEAGTDLLIRMLEEIGRERADRIRVDRVESSGRLSRIFGFHKSRK